MNLRVALHSDLTELSNIENMCFPPSEAADPVRMESRLSIFPGHFLVLYDELSLYGFINGMTTDEENLRDEMYENAALNNDNGAWQMVFGLCVVPEHRGKGYAKILMNGFISMAKREGRKGVVLTCKENLLKFYERFGFIDEGVSLSQHGGVCWHEMRLTF